MTADELFEKGLVFLRGNNYLSALACFEKAHNLKQVTVRSAATRIENESPIVESHLGLCIAHERGKITEAVALCRNAISKDSRNPVHYINLAKVLLKAGNKDKAIETLRQGLVFADSPDIHQMLDDLGTRKKLLFPFLPRKNFLNRYPGFLFDRLKLR